MAGGSHLVVFGGTGMTGLCVLRSALKSVLAGFVSRTLSTRQLEVNVLPPDERGVGVLELNRAKARNALSRAMIENLESALESLAEDTNTRVLVLKSGVPGVFCAGADLKERLTMPESQVAPFVSRLRALMSRLASLPMPTIAAVDGLAVGGGLEMALACDLRVLSSDATLGLVETKLGIIPGAGGTQRLPRIVGAAKAKELVLTGRLVTPSEALNIGLVNEVVEQIESRNAAFLRAKGLADVMASNGPIALRMAKKAIDEGSELTMSEAMRVEEACYAGVVPTKDRIEGLAAFQEKRKPVFKGH
ncbi:unnamed protein product [Notodromas monacha]|uniref:Uncharacterized protein n=1 Tax=Notodromas monacha TaxID=399045 RepID=A0A7R9C0W0_9CRUS|nr:unnamed protein product [Notodromas monacha]CAG0923962.1 unnamed protein product [Notodromas monacha]